MSTEKPLSEMTNEDFARREMKRQIGNVAARLRDTAERIERYQIAVELVGQPGYSSFASLAVNLMSDLRGGMSNTMVEQVVQAAADADEGRIKAASLAGHAEAATEVKP